MSEVLLVSFAVRGKTPQRAQSNRLRAIAAKLGIAPQK